ncbi:outer membrane protein, partial [Helicobacter pylori]
LGVKLRFLKSAIL